MLTASIYDVIANIWNACTGMCAMIVSGHGASVPSEALTRGSYGAHSFRIRRHCPILVIFTHFASTSDEQKREEWQLAFGLGQQDGTSQNRSEFHQLEFDTHCLHEARRVATRIGLAQQDGIRQSGSKYYQL